MIWWLKWITILYLIQIIDCITIAEAKLELEIAKAQFEQATINLSEAQLQVAISGTFNRFNLNSTSNFDHVNISKLNKLEEAQRLYRIRKSIYEEKKQRLNPIIKGELAETSV